jgi:hypothetical protein
MYFTPFFEKKQRFPPLLRYAAIQEFFSTFMTAKPFVSLRKV